MLLNGLIIYGVFSLGALGALVVNVYGRKLALLDIPNERSSHEKVTPRGGGIGILATFVLCSILYSVPIYFWVSGLLLSLISFWGDRFEIGVPIRLGAQFLLAFCFLWFALMRQTVYALDFTTIAVIFFYLIFIVGTTNYYNFMDGINGIAAITGVVAFGLLGAYGIKAGKTPELSMLSFSMVAACMGFLPFNVPTARVFMGDVGSILLGFVFAGLVVMMSNTVGEFIMLTSFLFPFYADELVTLWERVQKRERLTSAHRRHLYQVLVNEAGVPHWCVSAGYGLVELMVGGIIWQSCGIGLYWSIGFLIFFLIIFVFFNNKIKCFYL